jgi:hypothetical protein
MRREFKFNRLFAYSCSFTLLTKQKRSSTIGPVAALKVM